jgi:hypothetical protein
LEEYFHYWVNAGRGTNKVLFVELGIRGEKVKNSALRQEQRPAESGPSNKYGI